MSDTIWVFNVGSGTFMMLYSKRFTEPSCLLPSDCWTGCHWSPSCFHCPQYSSDSHQIRSILNSISSKAFCPARESCGFQGPTAFLLPCHLVHTFPIYFLSLSGFLNVAGRQLQPLLWPCGLCSFGKTTAHSVTSFFFQQDMFFISWRFCAYKRSASHFPSFNSTIIFITWNMPEWSHLLWSKNPWAQGLF